MMDDIIIFGESSEEHDARVRAVFRRLEDNGVTLNFEKCEFAKSLCCMEGLTLIYVLTNKFPGHI